jgi:hypothetical protein
LISLLTIYHYTITRLSIFTLVGFTFELLLVILFLVGVELGVALNNKQLNKKENGEE